MNENPTTNVPGPAALDMMVRIVMSQTDMAQDDVMSALERTQYNVKQVIREYMTSGPLTAAASAAAASAAVSTNQLRFSEIRHFMDKSAETFRRNQEMTRIYQQVQEKKNQQAATAAAEAATAQQQQQQQRSKL